MKIVLCTTLALLAFAGNSVLCRLALGEGAIDAASFTIIRLLSGIIVLAIILQVTRSHKVIISISTSTSTSTSTSRGSWKASFMLFVYALTFSYAYISLETGVGALILFGSVQITMIVVGLFSGNRLHYSEWFGLIGAFSGFVYLVLPELTTPSLMGFILMCVSGAAWGFYTLAGRTSKSPMRDTAFNFIRTLPLVLILTLLTFQYASLSEKGILLAVLSGSIASGVGYTIWYIALGGLSTIQAAVLQLLVPVIAALGGVLFADEVFTLRLLMSSVMVLGGIMVMILGRYYSEQYAKPNKKAR